MSTKSDFSKGVDNASDMVIVQKSNRITLKLEEQDHVHQTLTIHV